MAPQPLPRRLLKYTGQQPRGSGHVQSNESQHKRDKGINVPMAMHLECMAQKQRLVLLSHHVLSSLIQSSVQLLKKLINPKENFFHVDNANEKFTTYGLVYKEFHHGPGFDCLYLISKGLFKNSLRENNNKVFNHCYP